MLCGPLCGVLTQSRTAAHVSQSLDGSPVHPSSLADGHAAPPNARRRTAHARAYAAQVQCAAGVQGARVAGAIRHLYFPHTLKHIGAIHWPTKLPFGWGRCPVGCKHLGQSTSVVRCVWGGGGRRGALPFPRCDPPALRPTREATRFQTCPVAFCMPGCSLGSAAGHARVRAI
jgi:hypothetical protein